MFRRDSSFLESRGPETFEDVSGWQRNLATVLLSAKSAGTLLDNLKQGLLISTDFSGYDAPRECLRVMLGALSDAAQVELPAAFVARSCDYGNPQKRCLMLQSDMYDGGAGCVFSDLHDRLSEEHRSWIAAAGPLKGMKPEEARDANLTVENFLEQHKDLLFSLASRSYCVQHNQTCPVHVLAALREVRSQAEEPDLVEHAAPANKRQRQCSPWWKKLPSGSMRLLHAEQEPIVCNFAGLVCTDYTPLGRKKGLSGAGLTEPTHAIWAAERKWLAANDLEDMFFTEN